MMPKILSSFILCAAAVVPLCAQKPNKRTADVPKFDIMPVQPLFDAKWDVQLNPDNAKQILVIVDLTSLSPLKSVRSLVVKVGFYGSGKLLGTEGFDMLKGLIKPLVGGAKFSRVVEYDTKKYPPKGITVKPVSLDGQMDTNFYVSKPPDQKDYVPIA